MPQTFANAYALLIAVDEHRSPSAALPEIAQDVAAIHDVLIHPERCGYAPGNVLPINGSDATKDGILDGLDWLKARLDADTSGNATVVIYYTGHGHLEGGEYFLIPFDTNLGRIRSSALRATDFADEIAALQPQRLMVMLDCCHAAGMDVKGLEGIMDVAIPPALFSGGAAGSQGGKGLDALAMGSGRAILSSSKASEKSWIRKDGKMSIFTWHVIEALTGHAEPKAGAREVLVSDVMGHVHRRVPDSARSDWDADQHPDSFVSGNFPVSLLLGGKGLTKGATAPAPNSIEPPPSSASRQYQAVAGHDAAIAQGEGTAAAAPQSIIIQGGNAGNSNTGTQIIGNLVINNGGAMATTTGTDALIRQTYLDVLSRQVSRLQLRAFDLHQSKPSAVVSNNEPSLIAVYTALDVTQGIVRTRDDYGDLFDEEVVEPNTNKANRERPRRALEAAFAYRRLVLLGEPGSGKSTFGNHLIYCLSQMETARRGQWFEAFQRDWKISESSVLPVRVILRDFDAWIDNTRLERPVGAETLTEFVSQTLSLHNLSSAAPLIETALEAGKALVVLDGLDEVTSLRKRAFVRDAINAMADRYSRSRFLVTCRTRSYAAQIADSPIENPRLPGFQTAELAPFDWEKIDTFIDAWYAELERADRLDPAKANVLRPKLRAAVRRRDLHRLATNPLQLTLMAWVNTFDGVLPDKRARLYAKAVDLLLWRWESEKPTSSRSMRDLASDIDDGEDRIKRMLSRAAFEAHGQMKVPKDDENNDLFAQELRRLTNEKADALADLNELALCSTLANMKRDSEGRGDANWARDVVNALKMRSGLLAQSTLGFLTFPHRTFQEYLAGLWLLEDRFVEQIVDLSNRLDLWREVILLAIGHSVYVMGDRTLEKPLLAARKLCPTKAETSAKGWIRARLAGDILSEAGPDLVDEKDSETANRVRQRLKRQLIGRQRTAKERSLAGESLARLGDPRFDRDFHCLPIDELRGFVHVPADQEFRVGTRTKDGPNIRKVLADSVLEEEFNDALTPTPEFFIARYPVTVAQWWAYVDTMRSRNPAFASGEEDSRAESGSWPVSRVYWREALAYCAHLEELLVRRDFFKRPEFAGLRWRVTLPSELEWEKAARGETTTIYPWGDTPDPNRGNCNASGVGATSAVGAFPANSLGCYDMIGNLWEWTRSKFVHYPYDANDGRETIEKVENASVILRGGSWKNSQKTARCAYRHWVQFDDRSATIGFRVAITSAT